ncbi:MAG: hypothetical protein L0Y36_06350 [Planctomycetales bacterium]|nr:hypothetical protein [Planctomycetales bacterium]
MNTFLMLITDGGAIAACYVPGCVFVRPKDALKKRLLLGRPAATLWGVETVKDKDDKNG